MGVGAPNIRDPSLNLGVGAPNIGVPSSINYFYIVGMVRLVLGVGAPKIRNPSPNLGVGAPNIGDPSPSKKVGKFPAGGGVGCGGV